MCSQMLDDRYSIKFIVQNNEINKILNMIKIKETPESNCIVSSIYLDYKEGYLSNHRSLKKKISTYRLRYYNNDIKNVHPEKKIYNNNRVKKIRYNKINNIDYKFDNNFFVKYLFLSYKRKSFQNSENTIRITLDTDIYGYLYNNVKKKNFKFNVLEVKCLNKSDIIKYENIFKFLNIFEYSKQAYLYMLYNDDECANI